MTTLGLVQVRLSVISVMAFLRASASAFKLVLALHESYRLVGFNPTGPGVERLDDNFY